MNIARIATAAAVTGVAAHLLHRSLRKPAGATAPSDSPNAAERLQAEGIADRLSAGGDHADLLASDSQEGPYAQRTGLADFARGA